MPLLHDASYLTPAQMLWHLNTPLPVPIMKFLILHPAWPTQRSAAQPAAGEAFAHHLTQFGV